MPPAAGPQCRSAPSARWTESPAQHLRVAPIRAPGDALQSCFGTSCGEILLTLEHFAHGSNPHLNPAIKQVLTIFVGTQLMFRTSSHYQDLPNMKKKYISDQR